MQLGAAGDAEDIAPRLEAGVGEHELISGPLRGHVLDEGIHASAAAVELENHIAIAEAHPRGGAALLHPEDLEALVRVDADRRRHLRIGRSQSHAELTAGAGRRGGLRRRGGSLRRGGPPLPGAPPAHRTAAL
ncbi:MAG: hypothetical protein ACO4CW_12265, partial [Planctomycetota bacterium]